MRLTYSCYLLITLTMIIFPLEAYVKGQTLDELYTKIFLSLHSPSL